MSNTVNLNAELFRQLSYIADDEAYMKKALDFIKKLASQKVASEEVERPLVKEEPKAAGPF